MDLENFFCTPGRKYFTSPRGLRKFFRPISKNILQVHVDLENFVAPQAEKIFYKSTWT